MMMESMRLCFGQNCCHLTSSGIDVAKSFGQLHKVIYSIYVHMYILLNPHFARIAHMWSFVLSTHQFVEISWHAKNCVWKTETQVPAEGSHRPERLGIAYNNHILYNFSQAGD